MSAATLAPDPMLAMAVVRHLDEQLVSARRLLELILQQGSAIRSRDVEGVLARLSEVKTEMALREQLEDQRTRIVLRAGALLGVPAEQVTLDGLTALMPPEHVDGVKRRSAELRGLLAEIAREHGLNRALMRQELAFVDHLVRLIDAEPTAGYERPDGAARPRPEPATAHRVLNLEA